MEGFLKIFNKVNNVLVQKLEPEAGKDSVDLLEFTNYSALDIALGKLNKSNVLFKLFASFRKIKMTYLIILLPRLQKRHYRQVIFIVRSRLIFESMSIYMVIILFERDSKSFVVVHYKNCLVDGFNMGIFYSVLI